MRRIEPRQPQGEVEPTICQTETAEQTASRLVLLTRSPRMEQGLRYFLNFRADVIPVDSHSSGSLLGRDCRVTERVSASAVDLPLFRM
jgi:hypothetical protein